MRRILGRLTPFPEDETARELQQGGDMSVTLLAPSVGVLCTSEMHRLPVLSIEHPDCGDWRVPLTPDAVAAIVRAATMAVCRSCSECVEMTHHWTPDPRPDVQGDYACKHCKTRGDECETCYGAGCEMCEHEGVIAARSQCGLT